MRIPRTLVAAAAVAVIAAPIAAQAKPGPTVYHKKVCHTWQPRTTFDTKTVCASVAFVNRVPTGITVRSLQVTTPYIAGNPSVVGCAEFSNPQFQNVTSVFASGVIGYYGDVGCPYTALAKGDRTYSGARGRVLIDVTANLPMGGDHYHRFDFDICRNGTACTR